MSCPVLVRLPRTDDDRLLGAIRAFPCLPPCLEDERLRVWRRFLPRFERRLMVEEDVMCRTYGGGSWCASSVGGLIPTTQKSFYVFGLYEWVQHGDCAMSSLTDPGSPSWNRRRFGPSLAVSFGISKEELRERFVRLNSRGFSCHFLAGGRVFSLGLRYLGGRAQLPSWRRCNGHRGERPLRRGLWRSAAWTLGSCSLVGRTSRILVSGSLTLPSPGLWRNAVGLRLFLHHGVVAPGLVLASVVEREKPAVLLSLGARRQAGARTRRLRRNCGESAERAAS
ncbi:hypothetical protein MRX96_052830, partial [Rhipicephalus microplus]